MAPSQQRRIRGVTQRCKPLLVSLADYNALSVLRVTVYTALILFSFASSSLLFAQTVNDPRWRNFKQDDGLTSNDIWSILIDNNEVWFGENGSLTRFDGVWVSHSSSTQSNTSRFNSPQSDSVDSENSASSDTNSDTPLQRESRPSLDIQGDVTALARSVDGEQIWIGTYSGQISLFAPTFSEWGLVGKLDAGIWDIAIDDRFVWLGTEQGLYRVAESGITGLLDGNSGNDLSTKLAALNNDIQLELVASDPNYGNEPHLTQPVYELFQHNGSLFVGGATGLRQLIANTWLQIPLPTAAAFINPAEMWCAAAGQASETVTDDIPLSVHAVWVDPQNGLWIGTPYGAARRNVNSSPENVDAANCWTIFPTYTPEGMPSLVQALVGNGEGSTWAVTDGGGALLFEEYGAVTLAFGRNVPGNLNTNFVRDVAIDQDGAVWFATPVGVFQYLDRTWYLEPGYAETMGMTVTEPDVHDIRDLVMDRAGLLWIATGAGVRVKETPTSERRRFDTETSGLPGNNIFSLAEDRDSGIWAGTDSAGVARFVAGQWTIPIDIAQLPSPGVPKIVTDDEGMVWLGTDSGLVVYSLDSGALTVVDGLANQTIKALEVDSTNRLWVASSTRGELERQDGTISRLTPSDDGFTLQQEPLLSIFDGEELPYEFELSFAADYRFPGGMWLAIDQVGLYFWDGSKWQDGDPDRDLPTNFLWTLYTTPGSDDLWVGNEGGVSRFDGRTWGTLKDVDGLASSAIWAIAGSREKGFWFGGRNGLSYYRPDNTPPWVRIQEISGEIEHVDDAGFLTVGAGESLNLAAIAGDLQTPQDKLELYYRRVPLTENGEADLTDVVWRSFSGLMPLATDRIGSSRVELQARDLAFNYSEILAIPVAVVPANVIDLTAVGLGKVERNTFFTLIALSILAILGFGYVSLEIVQTRNRAIEAMVRSYNPYVSGQPIRHDDMFFGRHDLLQRIVNTLHNNSIMLHGERRIGKTTMLYQIASRLTDVDDPDYWFVPVYVDLEGTEQELFFHFLIEEIVHQIERGHGWGETEHGWGNLIFHNLLGAAYTDREFNRDLRRVIRTLQAYGERHFNNKKLRLILMMDEMDVMSSYDHLVQQQLRRIFMRDFASTMGAVVAGIQISKDWDRIESPWYNMFNEIEIEPFTDEQGVELLVEPVKEYYSYDSDAIDFIIQHSEGRPFRIQQYGLEVVTSMLAAGRRRVKLEDVLAAHQNIQNSYTNNHNQDGLFQDRHARAKPRSSLAAIDVTNKRIDNSDLRTNGRDQTLFEATNAADVNDYSDTGYSDTGYSDTEKEETAL